MFLLVAIQQYSGFNTILPGKLIYGGQSEQRSDLEEKVSLFKDKLNQSNRYCRYKIEIWDTDHELTLV